MWRGYVLYDGNKKFPIWARVQISMKMLRAKALEPLRPGVAVKASQIAFEKVEGFPDLRGTPQSLKAIEGYLPRHFIAANDPVWSDAIDPPYDIAKGDRATVMVHSGQAQLRFDAEAQASGRRGDQLSFKNPESGRLFRARIAGPGQAAIETSPVNE
jgi:flagella basal body P-ring formation protein FlgA